MQIFIKSFNRPYYLDRCIQSIYQFVSGHFSIVVLDDGTPEHYLDMLLQKYPSIEIKKSKNHKKKQNAIAENLKVEKEIDGFSIPTDLWFEAATNASDYFIMTEDDVWFTQPIDLDAILKDCKDYSISLLKLGWLGNMTDRAYTSSQKINSEIYCTIPHNLLLFPSLFNDWFFYNKYKFHSLLYKLKIVDNHTKSKYWTLNSILMGLWHKDYWLYIWKDALGKVDETQQLRNATEYYKKNKKNPNFIARLSSENMKTTFQSSATNSYHKYGENFDVNYFNHLMNEAWFNGTFNAMEGFPSDIPMGYFEQFFNEKINTKGFENWVAKFKSQYRNIGCSVDE